MKSEVITPLPADAAEPRTYPAVIKQLTGGKSAKSFAEGHGRLFLFFGVILPILAITYECVFHFCARTFFDPFPSASHVILFALIPISNFLSWLSTRRDLSQHYGFMALISGMATGIGCLYTLMFLPLSGISAICILFCGFGLLGLAPILSLPCSWMSGQRVCKLAATCGTYFNAHQVEHIGHLIILVMVVAVELPSTLTRINLGEASRPETANEAIQWLRSYGSEDVMLRACYERSGRATDILGSLYESGHPLSIDDARAIFYRVTGKPFNSVPIPQAARATIQPNRGKMFSDPYGLNAGVEDEFDLDSDIAGESVSSVARGLSVNKSEVVANVDPDALVANLSWTFGFASKSKVDREARAKILLPVGAVVNKATLYIDGVEHDATIMVREEARNIYRRSVEQHKKDPLLVSMAGPSEILVQCYPVPPHSTVKIKLNIVSPLELAGNGDAVLVMPTFEERNFQVDSATSVDLQAKSSADLQTRSAVDHRVFDQASLSNFGAIARFPRDKDCSAVFCRDELQSTLTGSSFVERKIAPRHYTQPKHLSVVVDGSVSMKPFMNDVISSLRSLPKDMFVSITVVRDGEKRFAQDVPVTSPLFEQALERLAKFQLAGGQDDSSAVLGSLITTVKTPDNAVLWIHSAQPLSSINHNAVSELCRSTHRPLLYDLPVVAAPNSLLEGTTVSGAIVRVSRSGAVADDLRRLFSAWLPADVGSGEFHVYNDPVPESVLAEHQADQSLATLRAYDTILAELASGKADDAAAAASLTSIYHLVTPISSAVVAEVVPVAAIAKVASSVDIESLPPQQPKSHWYRPVQLPELQSQGHSFSSPLTSMLKAKQAEVSSQLNALNRYSTASTPGPMPCNAGSSSSTTGTTVSDSGATAQSTSSYPRSFSSPAPPSSPASSAVPEKAQRQVTSSEEPPSPTVVDEVRGHTDSTILSAGSMRRKAEMDGDNFRSSNKEASPYLEGATNGTIGPTIDDRPVVRGFDGPVRSRFADKNFVEKKDASALRDEKESSCMRFQQPTATREEAVGDMLTQFYAQVGACILDASFMQQANTYLAIFAATIALFFLPGYLKKRQAQQRYARRRAHK